MARAVFLDAGPLGMVTHPRANPKIAAWFMDLLNEGQLILVPEIADYEVRRELLRSKKRKGVQRLDELKALAGYVAITTPAMLKAAQLWADTRATGKPTADKHALDGDVILAAQALTFSGASEIVIATDNVGHLGRFAPAERWESIH